MLDKPSSSPGSNREVVKTPKQIDRGLSLLEARLLGDNVEKPEIGVEPADLQAEKVLAGLNKAALKVSGGPENPTTSPAAMIAIIEKEMPADFGWEQFAV